MCRINKKSGGYKVIVGVTKFGIMDMVTRNPNPPVRHLNLFVLPAKTITVATIHSHKDMTINVNSPVRILNSVSFLLCGSA